MMLCKHCGKKIEHIPGYSVMCPGGPERQLYWNHINGNIFCDDDVNIAEPRDK